MALFQVLTKVAESHKKIQYLLSFTFVRMCENRTKRNYNFALFVKKAELPEPITDSRDMFPSSTDIKTANGNF